MPPPGGCAVPRAKTDSEERDLKFILSMEARRDHAEAERRHFEIVEVLAALGTDARKHRREAVQRLRATVSELYSAPRVTGYAARHARLGFIPGTAFDLTTNDENGNPWDFSVPSQRAKAERRLEKEKPLLLIGSLMCRAFSRMQGLNWHRMSPELIKRLVLEGIVHLQFCFQLYQEQEERGHHG